MVGKDGKGNKGEAQHPEVLRTNQVTEELIVAALAISREDGWKELSAPKALNQIVSAKSYRDSGLEKAAAALVKSMQGEVQSRPKGFEAQTLSKLQSDKAFDVNGDGKVDDKEMAAILAAGSLDGKKFDGNFSKQDRENLLSGKNKEAVIAIARELVNGAGVTTAAPAAPAPTATRGTVVATSVPQR